MRDPLLRVTDLRTWFNTSSGVLHAVDGIDFEIKRGETFALVGESGSGKSLTALSIMRLLPAAGHVSGAVFLEDQDLLRLPEAEMRQVRGGRIAMIFQEPMTSLNPVLSVGEQIGESLLCHQGLRGAVAHTRVLELLDAVGIAEPRRSYGEYPHQLSGGMKQRVMIAIALAGEPELLIADEPTTALDVTIQAQILELLRNIQRDTGMAILLITHDLGVVSEMADRVAVMYAGKIVESAERERFFGAPQHPYTKKLFDSLPGKSSVKASPGIGTALLQVRDLKVYFPIQKGLFKRTVGYVRAVDGVTLDIAQGRTLALVGESGSGKTTVGKSILQLIRPTAGSVRFGDTDLMRLKGEALRARRADFQIVFQDPYSSLNPRMLIADIIEEGMIVQGVGGSPAERAARVDELLEQVGLSASMKYRYPHEFSGGQRQRIAIARALAVNPKLIICDEPTSALDVSVQAQILNLLKRLQDELGLAYLFITHNLAVVEYLAHDVAVMYQGKIVEYGDVEQVLHHPRHPYTQALLSAVPKIAGRD
ncbi:MAG: ABC transporter ATP-binding protein [Pseudomonadota bacterium]